MLVGPGTGSSLSVTVPQLSRLTQFDRLLNADGTPSPRLIGIWQTMCEQIEGAFTALSTQVNDNTAIIAEIRAAQALATAANDNATSTAARVNIESSYPSPPNVLTASNAGNVTIAAHTRVYADGSEVSVGAGSVSGFSGGDTVTVYYVDSAREGGSVTYQGTTNAVAQANNTHVVGTSVIPAAGQPDATGTPVTAPGVPVEYYEAFEGYNPRY